MITCAQIDAALDTVGDEDSPAGALADLLDRRGEWDWSDGAEQDPSDRVAIVESSGAWWAVYRGTEGDEASRCATREEADAIATRWIDESTGGAS